MNFKPYKDHIENYYKTYSRYYDKYPYAMIIFEWFIRVPDEEYSKSKHFLDLKKFNYKLYILRKLFNFISLISILVKSKPKVISNLPRFSFIDSKLRAICQEKGYTYSGRLNNTSDKPGFKTLICLLLLKRFPFEDTLLCSIRFYYLFSKIAEDGLQKTLDNDSLMNRLNIYVKNEIDAYSRNLERINVHSVFSQGDKTPRLRVFCESVKKAQSKYIVIAHGYIVHPHLVSFCPVHADKLIVWNVKQLEDLSDVLPDSEIAKVLYIGWPKEKVNLVPPDQRDYRKALILLRPLEYENNNLSESIIEELKNNKFSVTAKMHPKDYKIKENIRYIKEKFKIDVSASSYEEELIDSDIVLSCVSSALVEGLENGVPSFQLEEMKWWDMDEVPDISINEISRYYSKYENFIKENHFFNNDTDLNKEINNLISNDN
ncbi:hypothetical protein [Natronogracilivirga saccharolytica]|uniref:Uncharacterized protein n=1 Tax=Natronogracilivirga saccharolytica TaxID=2812953 RepID=A0A8J7UY08_9BACT|nr:hypothetical protein [Natronogracilivirga saccharolytica]MBP3193929.1 hypothetical protein [Natronogracilivirga saccharolytica]